VGRPNTDEGFTLVELMVVVLIIGILVAIAIPVFNSAQDSARRSTCFSNQRVIEGSAQQYRAYTGGVLWTQTRRLNGNNTPNSVDQLIPAYIKSAPVCPTSKGYYYVDSSGSITGDNGDAAWIEGHTHY
jgi:prepilin-type N-terminal cleavage/methylation domain-containing protein